MEDQEEFSLLSHGGYGQDIIDKNVNRRPPEEVPAWIDEFRAGNSLNGPEGTEAVLNLLDMGGMRRHDVHSAVVVALRAKLIERVKDLAAKREFGVLRELLEESFFQVTVTELQPVCALIYELGREKVFDDDKWRSIHDQGYDVEAAYHSLPFNMKAFMWSKFPVSLEHEIRKVLRLVEEFKPPTNVSELINTRYYVDTCRQLVAVDHLVKIMHAALRVGKNVFGVILDLFVQCAAENVRSVNKCVGLGNTLLDFLTQPVFGEDGKIKLGDQNGCLYPHMVAAATIISKSAMESSGGFVLVLNDINLLSEFFQGKNPMERSRDRPESIQIIALMLHSSIARNVLAQELVARLVEFDTGLGQDMGALRIDSVIDRLKNNHTINGLTYLAMGSIKAGSVIESGRPLRDAEWKGILSTFYPYLLETVREDGLSKKRGASALVGLPNSKLQPAMRVGVLERRLMCSYAFITSLPLDPEDPSSRHLSMLSRLALVLDEVLGVVAAGTTIVEGEEREKVLCEALLYQSFEDV